MQSFKDLPLSPALQKSIAELGFEKPSPIQAQALPLLLGEPTDFLGLAATGTGKTAAFSIPLLEKIDPRLRAVQALVLCPTRELALQVSGQIDLLGKHLGVTSVPVYGGSSYRDQIRGIRNGAPIVVGTPGRVLDHIEQGTLDLTAVSLVVLDEADEMISMGFREAIETVLGSVESEESKIWLFSATMSRDVRKVADEFLSEPKQVEVNRTEMLPDTIEQRAFITHEGNKPDVICKLIDAADEFYGLIFCQTKALVMELTQFLHSKGYAVDCLHGEKDQNQRERTLNAYRERKVTILVCTDVASRGIDVKDVTHVINYSIPRELDNYVHRIGRTGRSGKTGFAFSLVAPSQRGILVRVERMTKKKILEGKIPTRKEIGMKKVSALLSKWENAANHERATALLNDTWKTALTQLSAEEIAGRFLALAYPDVFAPEAAPAPMGNTRERSGRDGGARRYEPRDSREPRPRSRYMDRDEAPVAPAKPLTSPAPARPKRDDDSGFAGRSEERRRPRPDFVPNPFEDPRKVKAKRWTPRGEDGPRDERSSYGPPKKDRFAKFSQGESSASRYGAPRGGEQPLKSPWSRGPRR